MRAKHLRRRPHQTSFTQRDKRYSARDQGELIKAKPGGLVSPLGEERQASISDFQRARGRFQNQAFISRCVTMGNNAASSSPMASTNGKSLIARANYLTFAMIPNTRKRYEQKKCPPPDELPCPQ
jgi:hypothetical protein